MATKSRTSEEKKLKELNLGFRHLNSYEKMESVNNTISRDVNFWVDSVSEGYIIEIAMDTIKSYSEVVIGCF